MIQFQTFFTVESLRFANILLQNETMTSIWMLNANIQPPKAAQEKKNKKSNTFFFQKNIILK